MATIVQKDHKVLRQISKEVALEKITSPEIRKIIKDMKDAMHAENDAVAIAAPQIAVALRIFVMAGKARLIVENERRKNTGGEELILNEKDAPPDEVFINPVITKISRDKKLMEEGCLSVRYLYGKVQRGEKVVIEAYDEEGNKFKQGASGLIAQIFQHETDHLEGVLFIDKAKDVVELSSEERETWAKKQEVRQK